MNIGSAYQLLFKGLVISKKQLPLQLNIGIVFYESKRKTYKEDIQTSKGFYFRRVKNFVFLLRI